MGIGEEEENVDEQIPEDAGAEIEAYIIDGENEENDAEPTTDNEEHTEIPEKDIDRTPLQSIENIKKKSVTTSPSTTFPSELKEAEEAKPAAKGKKGKNEKKDKKEKKEAKEPKKGKKEKKDKKENKDKEETKEKADKKSILSKKAGKKGSEIAEEKKSVTLEEPPIKTMSVAQFLQSRSRIAMGEMSAENISIPKVAEKLKSPSSDRLREGSSVRVSVSEKKIRSSKSFSRTSIQASRSRSFTRKSKKKSSSTLDVIADQDSDSWESYSVSSSESEEETKVEEVPEVIEEVVPVHTKGKKKDKKGKVEDTIRLSEQIIPGQTSLISRIVIYRIIAERRAINEAIEKEKELNNKIKLIKRRIEKANKSKGKKESPGEKQAREAECQKMIETEMQRMKEEEEQRAIYELEVALEKEERDIIEQNIRMEQLGKTGQFIEKIRLYSEEILLQRKKEEEWLLYLKCDGLPDPSSCPQMNQYLHVWKKTIERSAISEISQRTQEVITLLDTLDDLIYDSFGVPPQVLENWKWERSLFRDALNYNLEMATYRHLRNIALNLNRIDVPTADFNFEDENGHITINMWVHIRLPISLPNPRKPKKPPVKLAFENLNIELEFPLSIGEGEKAICLVYLRYDHLSDTSRTYFEPKIPDANATDFKQVMLEEWNLKSQYKFANEKLDKLTDEEGVEKEAQYKEIAELLENTDVSEMAVPYQKLDPTASQFAIRLEDESLMLSKQELGFLIDKDEVNLRKFRVLGGIYDLKIYYPPAQPCSVVAFNITVTKLKIPDKLEPIPFYEEYVAPEPPEEGTIRSPEEIEEEMKKQEAEFSKLIMITLELPTHVMWMELPSICFWEEEAKMWSTKDVHDVKHNEDKGCVTFRTGKFGSFSFFSYKYSNLPFQAWEMKPESDGTVLFQVTAAIIMIEFRIKGNMVCVTQLQNAPTETPKDILNQYYYLHKLIRILQSRGIDIFPAFDTITYVEGACEKHWPMEKHLYYCMAQLCQYFNFAWSRWNMAAGRRNIVMQMRQYKPELPKQRPHSMLLVTPLKSMYIDCTEVSQVFNPTGVDGMKFFSDLFHLIKGTASMAVKAQIKQTPFELINTIAELLIATKVLSYS